MSLQRGVKLALVLGLAAVMTACESQQESTTGDQTRVETTRSQRSIAQSAGTRGAEPDDSMPAAPRAATPPPTTRTVSEPAPRRTVGWPTHPSGGSMAWTTMAFPTGNAATSAVGLEKGTPREVRLGQSFDYELIVTNLTDVILTEVAVMEDFQDTFRYESSDPSGREGAGGRVTWTLGDMAPRESRTIRVRGVALAEGLIGNCATVSYNSLLCATIPVVQPQLQITKAGPAEVLKCDVIEYRFVVSNPGSGSVSGVQISDPLPAGLTTVDGGASNITIDVGTLGPGESKPFTRRVRASRVGNFTNNAEATGEGNLRASSNPVSTLVRAPELDIQKTGPDRVFVGRQIEYAVTVMNTGDGDALATIVEDTIPAGCEFVSASNNGRFAGGKVMWDLGTLAAGASRSMTVTVSPTAKGRYLNEAMANADCADAVTAEVTTEVLGIPAILLEVIDIEDPDQVGTNEVYEITVTNQGSAVGTGIQITAMVEAEQRFESATGPTNGTISGQTMTFEPLPSLAPKDKATWRVTVRNLAAGDVRFAVRMISDQLTRPVEETEATNIYE